jgi:hypothetical protein
MVGSCFVACEFVCVPQGKWPLSEGIEKTVCSFETHLHGPCGPRVFLTFWSLVLLSEENPPELVVNEEDFSAH